ncbi:restriction endonuclease subunit S [Pseudoalteromonas tetraodonis]|nr:restriction endonuclease subunit S [Pseudoalteromonas tetraodonis]
MPNIPNGWYWAPLSDLCKKVSVGHVGETSSVFCGPEGVTFLRSQNVRPGRLDLNDVKYVTKAFHEKSKKSQLKTGDILVVRVGQNRGDCAVVPDNVGEINCANIVFAQPKDIRYSDYLGYFLNSSFGRTSLLAVSTGSAQGVLNTKSVAKVVVPVPPIDLAKNIGYRLKLIDNKIELNQKTNQTLEQMAQALFKSWFIDFDPVFDNLLASVNFNLENLETSLPDELKQKAQRRLAALNSLHNAAEVKTSLSALAHELQALSATQAAVQAAETPVKASLNANPKILAQHANTHAHFPNEFEHNEQLGWIPKGWGVGVSGDLVDVRDGTHDSPKKSEKGFPLVTSKHITSGRLDLSAAYLISELDYKKVNERSNVEYGDILLTMIGTVGVPYLVMDEPANYAIKNVGLFRTSQNLYLKNYLHILLKTAHMQAYLNARVAGTTQKYLSLKVLRNIDFLLPSNIVLEKFNSIVNNMLFKEKSNIDQINQLTKLRDTLLPKLISGELQIPDVITDEEVVD